jgi:hypothetical protein
MWLLPVYALFAAVPPMPIGVPVLPSNIRTVLDAEYPGWKLATVTPQIQQEFKKHRANRLPSLAVGDFDHDGKKDYAVQISLNTPGQEEQIVIIFLARDTGYEENIVQSMGIDPTTYLWVANKPYSVTGPDAQERLGNRDVLMILGGPVGDTIIAYEDGKLQEIKSTEDPEHPDPSLPRVPIPL